MNKKMKFLTYSVCMGILAAGLNMLCLDKSTNAAVQVIDQRNIEQAIEQLVKTTSILTTEQQNLALQIIHAKKFDLGMISGLISDTKTKRDFMEACTGDYEGLLQSMGKNDDFWTIQNVENIMNGNVTIYDAYFKHQQGVKEREKAAKDAAKTAKAALEVANKSGQNSEQHGQMIANAEGTDQLLEAQDIILMNGNDIAMAHLQIDAARVVMEAAKIEQENFDKAMEAEYNKTLALSYYKSAMETEIK